MNQKKLTVILGTAHGKNVAGKRSPDGSTLIEATGVTPENIRVKFIAGLIGLEYNIDDQIAILANGEDNEEHSKELADFMLARSEAKKNVDEVLSRFRSDIL